MAQRELREGARRPANYRLRVGSGLAAAGMLWWTIEHERGTIGATGATLFLRLHCLLLLLIFGIVPTLAADCIARERREGTLGLLFLTPLTAQGVVLGKSLAQALRAMTLWLSALPVLTLPFLSGGIKWDMTLHLITVEFCAAMVCLAAGLAASTLATKRGTVFFLAYALAGLWLAVIAICAGALRPLGPTGPWMGLRDMLTFGLLMATAGPTQNWVALAWAPSTASGILSAYPSAAWLEMLAATVAISGIILYLTLLLAAAVIRKFWKDEPASRRREEMRKRFCTPLFAGLLKWQARWMLDRNPIAWLQQHSWRTRASKWALCAVFILAESEALSEWSGGGRGGYFGDFRENQFMLALLLAAVVTFIGVSSFLEEKRNGALELLLVTPISVNRLILGRAWGLCLQFLPAAGILVAAQLAVTGLNGDNAPFLRWNSPPGAFIFESAFLAIFICGNAFIALPIFATYAALRVKNLVGAAALTWAALAVMLAYSQVVAQSLTGSPNFGMYGDDDTTVILCGSLALCNVVFVGLTFFLLRHSLSRRIYAF